MLNERCVSVYKVEGTWSGEAFVWCQGSRPHDPPHYAILHGDGVWHSIQWENHKSVPLDDLPMVRNSE